MKNKNGFTLVELLAVIAILAILVIIALPNVIGMFQESKKNNFLSETRSVYKVAKQTWVMDPMKLSQEVVYSKCATCTGEKLDLSGRNNFEYYIKINSEGYVTELYSTDGTYQYSYSAGDLKLTDITDVQTISELNEDETVKISNNSISGVKPFTMVEQKNEDVITRGDEFAIGSEHFYVVSSDNNNIVALAKYDLLVGDNVEYVNGIRIYTKVNHTNGYGYQNANVGNKPGAQATTGLVAFSGKLYWATGNQLKSEYGSQPNIHPIRDVHVFDMKYSNEDYAIDTNVINSEGVCSNFCNVNNNDYSVAYYVKKYVDLLKRMGAPTVTGRLLYDNEAADMNCALENSSVCDAYSTPYWLTNRSFWIDSLFTMSTVRHIESNRTLSVSNYNAIAAGVRPVIVIPKNDVKLITSKSYWDEKNNENNNIVY